jgi:hypothetical protein
LNALFCQQAGITYEFKTNRIGVEIATGYFYQTKFLYSKWSIEGIGYNDGVIYPYYGFYIIPQINLYLKDNNEKGNSYYVSLKGVYRKLHCDSTQSHFWHKEDNDNDYWTYRKQEDKFNIAGAFILFSAKHYEKHFFAEAYMGPGIMNLEHNLIIVGQHPGEDGDCNTSNVKPPLHEKVNYSNITVSVGLSFGFKF